MLINYLEASLDVLSDMVSTGEATLQEAAETYDMIYEQAMSEFKLEVYATYKEGELSAEDANLLIECAGYDDDDEYEITEASYDISKLSKEDQKAVMDRLNAMSPSQKKKAEEALAKKYPSAEYAAAQAAKEERKKKLLKGAAIAGAVGLGAAAVHAHNVKDADKRFTVNNPLARKAQEEANKEREELKKKYADILNVNSADTATRLGAKHRVAELSAAERREQERKFQDESDAIDKRLGQRLADIRNDAAKDPNYKKDITQKRKEMIKREKLQAKRHKEDESYVDSDVKSDNKAGLFTHRGRRNLATKATSPLRALGNVGRAIGNFGRRYAGKGDEQKELVDVNNADRKETARRQAQRNYATRMAKDVEDVYGKSPEE